VDLQALQLCKDEAKFLKALKLFIQKWKQKKDVRITDFEYFEQQWLTKNPYWYEGAALCQPSTNNGLESTNANIKKEHTLRERLPVGQFLNGAVTLVEGWSERGIPAGINCILLNLLQSP